MSYLRATSEIAASLPPSGERAAHIEQCATLQCRLALLLAERVGDGDERSELLARAAAAVSDALRLHQRRGRDAPAAEGARLQLLHFEVALRRGDPNLKAILLRAQDAPGVGADELRYMGELALRGGRHREVACAALEGGLELLLKAEPKDFASIAAVLRRLIGEAGGKAAAKAHYERAAQLVSGFTKADCPLAPAELHWLLSTSWNAGIAAYREERMPAAEEWLALAFRFTQVAPDSLMANGLKDEMRASYDNLLESMTGKPGATGSVWQRMRGYLRDDGEAHYGRSPRGG